MGANKPLTPTARVVFGLLFVGFGIFPMLASFDIGPLRSSDINGPPWLGLAAGGVFAEGDRGQGDRGQFTYFHREANITAAQSGNK